MYIPYENRTTDYYFRDDHNKQALLKCPPHLHVHIEFFLLIEGRTHVYIDSEEYTVESGDLLISFPNRVHSYDDLEKERYLLFIVHPDLMPELSHVFNKRIPTAALLKDAISDPDLLPLLEQLAAAITGRTAYRDITIKGLLLAVFGHILPRLELSESRNEDSHAIRDIINYCNDNFQNDLSLETLENALHLNRYYISHLFHHKLNIRFNDYVNSLRVSDACRLLRQTNSSITDICNCVGFNTLRTFNRSFMKQMGQSPSEYRHAHLPKK